MEEDRLPAGGWGISDRAVQAAYAAVALAGASAAVYLIIQLAAVWDKEIYSLPVGLLLALALAAESACLLAAQLGSARSSERFGYEVLFLAFLAFYSGGLAAPVGSAPCPAVWLSALLAWPALLGVVLACEVLRRISLEFWGDPVPRGSRGIGGLPPGRHGEVGSSVFEMEGESMITVTARFFAGFTNCWVFGFWFWGRELGDLATWEIAAVLALGQALFLAMKGGYAARSFEGVLAPVLIGGASGLLMPLLLVLVFPGRTLGSISVGALSLVVSGALIVDLAAPALATRYLCREGGKFSEEACRLTF